LAVPDEPEKAEIGIGAERAREALGNT